MALMERDVVFTGKDENGNPTVDLPITRLGNIEGDAEVKDAPAEGDYIPVVDGWKMKKMPAGALAQCVLGNYVGEYDTDPKGYSRSINLGFRPKAVIITRVYGTSNTWDNSHCGIAFDGTPFKTGNGELLTIVDNGFEVSYPKSTSDCYFLNKSDSKYNYIAFR